VVICPTNLGRGDVIPGTRSHWGHMASQTIPATKDSSIHTEAAPGGDAVVDPNLAIPELFVCHGDDGGPSFHPCRRVQEALRAAGIAYTKVIAGHGSPIPFLRRDAREELQTATGTRKLPTLKLADGTIITSSRAILTWVEQQS
jgi:Glutathione S-transferase, N-terminal domain